MKLKRIPIQKLMETGTIDRKEIWKRRKKKFGLIRLQVGIVVFSEESKIL